MAPRDLELAFVEAHFARASRARYARLLQTKKGRDRLRGELYHLCALLRDDHLVEVDDAREPADLARELERRGARGPAHVLSVAPELDGRTLDWRAAIDAALDTEGTLALDASAPLAFYRGELREGTFLIAAPRGGTSHAL